MRQLLELTQLSICQYARPNGEVIGLLVIAPSKSDRERVLPMSAELCPVRHVDSKMLPRLVELERDLRDRRRPPSTKAGPVRSRAST